MTRQNKKTRIKGLPPRLQLQQKDAATGSYPSNSRIASDNRTGDYTISYDDRNTIVFKEYNFDNLNIENNIIAYWKFNPDNLFSSVRTTIFEDRYNAVAFSASLSSGYNITDVRLIVTGGNDNAVKTETDNLPWRGNAYGRLNGALSFDRVAKSNPNHSFATTVSHEPFLFEGGNPDKPFTFSAWVNLTGALGNFAYIFYKVDDIFTDAEYEFGINSSGDLFLNLYEQDAFTGDIFVQNNNSVNRITKDSGWKHVVATYNGSGSHTGMNLYIDGVPITTNGSTNTYGGQVDTGSPLMIGITEPNSPIGWPGYFAELLILNRALSTNEVEKLYNVRTSVLAPIQGLALGSGLNVQSPFIKDAEQITNITITGPVKKGIGDAAATFTPGQDLTPFKENNNPALDGLSSTSSFYAVGTPVNVGGEGFDQPLWSKTKIQFELPVVKGISNTIRTFISGGHNNTINADPASGSVDKGFGPTPTTGGFVNLSYPMSYYNFKNQLWEGVGRGEAYCYTGIFKSKNGTSTDVGPFYNTVCIGFSQGLVSQREGIIDPGVSGAFEYMAGAGQPIANFGFPFDARYHATGAQLLPMNRFINEPFVVEKIVVDFSGSFEFESENYTTGTIVPSVNSVISSAFAGAINNFFILVQRKPYSFKTSFGVEARSAAAPILQDLFLDSRLPTNVTLSNGQGQTYVDTIRDVLTFGGVSSFAANTPIEVTRQGNVGNSLITDAGFSTKNPKQLMTRDIVFESSQSMVSNLTALNWSGSFRMELESRNPTRVFELFGIIEYGNNPDIGGLDTKFDFGGRNGLGVTSPSGRDIISPIVGINIESVATNGRTLKIVNLTDPKAHYRVGGYILKPEDNLIFGWQQPIPMTLTVDYLNRHVNDGFFSSMTFSDARITFYGSLLREGKEFHDTLNQLLISDSVHEVIE